MDNIMWEIDLFSFDSFLSRSVAFCHGHKMRGNRSLSIGFRQGCISAFSSNTRALTKCRDGRAEAVH